MSHSSSIKGTQDDPSIGLFLRVQYLSREIQERRQLEEARYAKLHSNYEYICEYCSRSYKLKTDLTHHMKRLLFRVTDLSILQEGSKECEDTRVETPKTWQRNEICAYVPFVPQEVPLQRLDNHLRLYEKDFRCEGCGKEYHGTRESMNHKRFKKPSEDFDLILCQKAFSSCSNFYQHPHWDQAMFARKILFSLLRYRRHHLRSLSPLQYDSSGDCWIGQELFAETIKVASWTWDYDRFEITFFANWDLECDFK